MIFLFGPLYSGKKELAMHLLGCDASELARRAVCRPGFCPERLAVPRVRCRVTRLYLMESARPDGVLTYTPVCAVPLRSNRIPAGTAGKL